MWTEFLGWHLPSSFPSSSSFTFFSSSSSPPPPPTCSLPHLFLLHPFHPLLHLLLLHLLLYLLLPHLEMEPKVLSVFSTHHPLLSTSSPPHFPIIFPPPFTLPPLRSWASQTEFHIVTQPGLELEALPQPPRTWNCGSPPPLCHTGFTSKSREKCRDTLCI